MEDQAAHLDRNALLRAAYAPEPSDERHLAACPSCAAAVVEIAARRSAASAMPELPEYFWQRQQAAIVAAARTSQPVRSRRWAAVLATGALLAAGALAVTERPAPAPVFSEADEALWRDAQESATRVTPPAFEPVRMLLPPSPDTKEIR